MKPSLPLFVFILTSCAASAAPIRWTVHDITGNVSEVSTAGTLVDSRAGRDYGTADVVDGTTFQVNGVVFDDDSTLDHPSHFDTINARAGKGLRPEYYDLLKIGDRQTEGDASITFQGLTIGNSYQIQIWASDHSKIPRDEGVVLNNGMGAAPIHGAPGHATLLLEVSDGGPGQYAVGTFIADGSSQTIQARLWKGLTSTPRADVNTMINAVQLRNLGNRGSDATQSAPPVTRAEDAIPPPTLVRLHSTETTMTLEFSQPMEPQSATDVANYTVSLKGGGTGSVESASLSADGRTITLTYGMQLVVDGSIYVVGFENLIGANGKPMAGAKRVDFRP